MVNNGVREFKTPARWLSIPVWALANKKGGKTPFKTPSIASSFHCFNEIFENRKKTIGNKTKLEIAVRNAPTSLLEKTVNPFFIRMNELPHVKTSKTKITHVNIVDL